MNIKILAVDDDDLVLQAMSVAFAASEFQLELASNATSALQLIKQNPIGYSLVFVDHNLGKAGPKGDQLAKQIKEINPSIMVVMVSGQEDEETLKSWLRADVDQFLIKPIEAFVLLSLAENSLSRYRAKYGGSAVGTLVQNDRANTEAIRKVGMVGRSAELGRVAQSALLFAQNRYNVLVLGESGTGKEVIAKAIHLNSAHCKKPFLPINCSGFRGNEGLLESELFGHEKGAFTGADRLKVGLFEAAQGGTVFLDELHLLPPGAQAKLLRAIQERKIRRVGGTTEISVDFRLISAAKPDLKQMSLDGPFTLDLYYRIKELIIEIPSLQARRDDIVPLLRHFKSVYEHDLKKSVEFMDSALERLQAYAWPGNVRELAGVVKDLLVNSKTSVIRADDLPEEFKIPHAQLLLANGKIKSLALLLAEHEMQQCQLVMLALSETEWNVSQACLALQIPRTTLRDLMKKFGLSEPVKNLESVKSSLNH